MTTHSNSDLQAEINRLLAIGLDSVDKVRGDILQILALLAMDDSPISGIVKRALTSANIDPNEELRVLNEATANMQHLLEVNKNSTLDMDDYADVMTHIDRLHEIALRSKETSAKYRTAIQTYLESN